MTHLDPIVGATDFSAPARPAVDRAGRLPHETGAAPTLLHLLCLEARCRRFASGWAQATR